MEHTSGRSWSLNPSGNARCVQGTRLPLGDDLSHVELDKHGAVCLELLDRHEESKVVEDQELNLKMIELHQRQPTNLEHI